MLSPIVGAVIAGSGHVREERLMKSIANGREVSAERTRQRKGGGVTRLRCERSDELEGVAQLGLRS
jgi:hypothetical protein